MFLSIQNNGVREKMHKHIASSIYSDGGEGFRGYDDASKKCETYALQMQSEIINHLTTLINNKEELIDFINERKELLDKALNKK